ncbi:pyridoxal-phosphate dependent enzyme [Hymenobacter sp. BRD128]|uniref:pyridoxal-phosphate dependent enzyme n=1 Tax=Hymenobacter sp. BRD128 TaxID=2675878 RepID=UPI0020B886A7|nr:pyridoxal-phosphate dependent enzyme [Hymenobacter sp. BRD128]
MGLEIFQDLPSVELVLTPVGGGGLLGGVAAALKLLKPSVKIIGVEPELAADAQASLRAGRVVEWAAADTNRTLADGVRTLAVSELTFAHIQHYADDIVTVSEAELRAAARRLLLEARLVVEPTAALPLAALLRHWASLPASQHTVLVLTGGNADPATLIELLRG